MVRSKVNDSKWTPSKKVISVNDVSIVDGRLIDEDGVDAIYEIERALPEGVDVFSFKITIEIPDNIEEEDTEYDDE